MQLEQVSSGMNLCLRMFQFHKGAIGTMEFSLHIKSIKGFNSIKVQLERYYPACMQGYNDVSIP